MSTSKKRDKSTPARRRQVKEKATKPTEHTTHAVAKPSGAMPMAIVMARHDGEMVQRDGRGFSIGELVEGGLPLAQAKKWGVPIDIRRRSVLGPNVSLMKKWFVPPKKTEKTPAPEKPKAARKEPKTKEKPRRRAA